MDFLAGRYEKYRSEGGEMSAMQWAFVFLPAAVFNEMFSASARSSSYGVPPVLLERRDGQLRVIGGKR